MYNLIKRKGFTLLEVLLSVAISSVLIVGLMLAFWRGSKAWERVKGVTELTHDIEFMDNVLCADLRNSIKLPDGAGVKDFKASDDKRKITFFSLKRLKKEKAPHVYKISYKLSKVNGSSNWYDLGRASYKIAAMENLNYEFDSSEYKRIINNLKGENIKFRGTPFGNGVELCNKKKNGETTKYLSIKMKKKDIVFPCKVIKKY